MMRSCKRLPQTFDRGFYMGSSLHLGLFLGPPKYYTRINRSLFGASKILHPDK